jgi:glycyl-tRNA synthetase beta subunit
MQTKDLETLQSIKQALTKTEATPMKIENPAVEVEKSLVGFLKHRLQKLQEVSEFEETIRESLLARMPEATFPQLMQLLDIVQSNNNTATEKVLAPFIAQNGTPTSLLPSKDEKETQMQLHDSLLQGQDEKKVLQSLAALNNFMELLKSKDVSKPTS